MTGATEALNACIAQAMVCVDELMNWWMMDDGRWMMDDGRWTMDDGGWRMEDG